MTNQRKKRYRALEIAGAALGAGLVCALLAFVFARTGGVHAPRALEIGHAPNHGIRAAVVAARARRAAHEPGGSRGDVVPPAPWAEAPASTDRVITLARGGAELSGRVLDVMGGPVPGALVTLRSPGTPGEASTFADDEGRFSANVPLGMLEVVARAEAFSTAQRHVLAPALGITLVLAPGAEIFGRVVDAQEQPVSGLSVVATSATENEELSIAAASGAHGEFRIAGLAAGPYQVAGLGAAWRSDSQQVSVAVAEVRGPLVLRAQPAAALTGRVLRASEPCAGAYVSANGPASGVAYRYWTRWRR